MLKDFVPEDKSAEQRSGKLVRKIQKQNCEKNESSREMKSREQR